MKQIALKAHYSATELAAMQLPDVPATKVGVRTKAKRESWPCVSITGVGGQRREFVPPTEIMEVIRLRAAQTLVASVPTKTISTRTATQLPLIETEGQALTTDARKGVLLAMQTLMNRSGYPLKKAARTLISMARSGEANPQLTAMLKQARDGRGRPSPDGMPSERSLLRFVEYEQAGMLAPKKRERDMSVPTWAPAFLSHYQKPEKPTVEHAYREYLRQVGEPVPADVPSVWQVRRFLSKVGNVTLQMGRMGDRELKTLKPFIRRGFDTLLPADVYSADGHTFDAEVQHPLHGRPFRPEITSVVDIATRRVVGWSVGLAESAFAVLDALRDSVFKGGIPAILYVDNGSGYKNQLMTDVATGLLSRLGIEMVNSLPYNSQARGVIERLHQTIWVNAAKMLPGYMGRDMDRQAKLNVFKLSRQALKAAPGETASMPLIGWPGFVEFCQARVDEYNDRPHRSLPKIADPASGRSRNMTPNEAWALAVAKGFAAHTVSDDEARPLFRPQVLRVIRRCEIELFGNRYFDKRLEEFHSAQLRIGYDIHDPARVWVYDDEGRFICTAALDANKRDYMPKSVLQRARESRAAGREQRLQVKLDEVREELHGTPVLEQMETVVMPGFMTITRDQLNQRSRDAQLVEVEAPTAAPVLEALPPIVPDTPEWAVPDNAQERWAEWQRLNLLPETEMTTSRMAKWRQTYQATAEFRTYQRKTA